jgi:hypothetical protein
MARWKRPRKRKAQPPVFTFERTLKRPDLSPRAAEYGLTPCPVKVRAR